MVSFSNDHSIHDSFNFQRQNLIHSNVKISVPNVLAGLINLITCSPLAATFKTNRILLNWGKKKGHKCDDNNVLLDYVKTQLQHAQIAAKALSSVLLSQESPLPFKCSPFHIFSGTNTKNSFKRKDCNNNPCSHSIHVKLNNFITNCRRSSSTG